MKVKKRAKGPLWVRCCELWDELEPHERDVVVKGMEYFVEQAEKGKFERLGSGKRGGGGEGEGG